MPRSLQSTAGLATATIVAGVTLGGLIGVVSALALGRFGRLGARSTVLLVTGLGFLATYVVPFLAYPPNPPAVGQPGTIGYRTGLYFILVAVSTIVGVTAVLVARRLAPRWGAWYATLACAAGVRGRPGRDDRDHARLRRGAGRLPGDRPLRASARRACSRSSRCGASIGLVTAELAHRLSVRGRRREPARPLVRAGSTGS